MDNDFLNTRIRRRCQLATELACLSDQRLSTLLNQAKPVHAGIGGTAVVLTIDGTPIFVKKIPLIDLERRPKNLFSTPP
ncbi:MAG: protein kinase family protein, partial [Holosporales bacterium]